MQVHGLGHIDFSMFDLDNLESDDDDDKFMDALMRHDVDQETMNSFVAFLASQADIPTDIETCLNQMKEGDQQQKEQVLDFMTCLQRAKYQTEKLEKFQSYWGFLPIRVVCETFARTTQMAKAVLSFPMSRHLKS